MPANSKHASRSRAALAALVVCLAGVAWLNFYRWGSLATDENLFTEPPSATYLLAPVAGWIAP
jgi:hypothetical protein